MVFKFRMLWQALSTFEKSDSFYFEAYLFDCQISVGLVVDKGVLV